MRGLNKTMLSKHHSKKWLRHIRHLPIWVFASCSLIIKQDPKKHITMYPYWNGQPYHSLKHIWKCRLENKGPSFFILPWVALVYWIDDCIPIFAFQRRFICWFIYIYHFFCCWDNWLLIVLKSMRIIPSLNKNFKFKRHSTKWFEHITHLPIWLVATCCTIIRPSKVISEYILLIQIFGAGSWK